MKKFLIVCVYWWAIIFPSLNFDTQIDCSNIEFRFKIVDFINQTNQIS